MGMLFNSCKKDEATPKGKVVFWNDVASHLGIVVVLMADNASGNITMDAASAPACDASGFFTYTNNPGTYSFNASEVGTSKIWSGSVIITSDGCATYRLF